MRIIFMGTPEFAVPSLDRLVEHGYPPTAVVTAPDRARGRGREVSPTPVKKAALRHGIQPLWQPESVKEQNFVADVRGHEPDLIVVVAFRILPADVFDAAHLGAFNLHGSLLPKYRGAAPINHAIMQGETVTGVTTFFLREKVDTGSIILQKEMPIGPNETAGEVHDRMMEIAAGAVLETVQLIENGRAQAHVQNDAIATTAPKIYREDCEIRWDRPAQIVHNQIRGLSPYPGAWTMNQDTQLKIYRTLVADESRVPSDPATLAPDIVHASGTAIVTDGRLFVTCQKSLVEVLELQQEGKKRLLAREFLRGYPLSIGAVLG